MARGARRGAVALLVVLVALIGIVLGARALWNKAQSAVASDGCDFGSYHLNLTRSQNAATIVGVVLKRGLPEHAAVLVLGAALQESKLDNIPAGQGDRDSVGVLQQRPSQGWGTEAQLADIRYATGVFLDAMLKVPDWRTAPLSQVIQEVQVSADGSAYARHESQATAMSGVLMGLTPGGVTCDFGKPAKPAATRTVASELASELPVQTPETSASVVRVSGAGWATTAWLITHAAHYGIDRVSYSGRSWIRSKGWRNDSLASSANEVRATLASLS